MRLTLAAAVLALAAAAAPAAVTVSGSGRAVLKADTAILSWHVRGAVRTTAAAAIADSDAQLSATLATLKDLGVDESSLTVLSTKSESVTVTTVLNADPATTPPVTAPPPPEPGQSETGIRILRQLRLEVADLSTLPKVLAGLAAKGIDPGPAKYEAHNLAAGQAQARKDAVADATAAASTYAGAAQITLGPVQAVVETGTKTEAGPGTGITWSVNVQVTFTQK